MILGCAMCSNFAFIFELWLWNMNLIEPVRKYLTEKFFFFCDCGGKIFYEKIISL